MATSKTNKIKPDASGYRSRQMKWNTREDALSNIRNRLLELHPGLEKRLIYSLGVLRDHHLNGLPLPDNEIARLKVLVKEVKEITDLEFDAVGLARSRLVLPGMSKQNKIHSSLPEFKELLEHPLIKEMLSAVTATPDKPAEPRILSSPHPAIYPPPSSMRPQANGADTILPPKKLAAPNLSPQDVIHVREIKESYALLTKAAINAGRLKEKELARLHSFEGVAAIGPDGKEFTIDDLLSEFENTYYDYWEAGRIWKQTNKSTYGRDKLFMLLQGLAIYRNENYLNLKALMENDSPVSLINRLSSNPLFKKIGSLALRDLFTPLEIKNLIPNRKILRSLFAEEFVAELDKLAQPK